MSHYNVAVFSQSEADVDELLEPYCESVEPGSEYSEFIEDDGCDIDEHTGKAGYWCNPEAKWDWYVVGGRWANLLKLNDGRESDSALVRDCIFRRDQEAYNKAIRFWEVYVDGKPLNDGESQGDFDDWYKPEYYKEQYKTKEKFADAISDFHTHAFITEDGEWYEKGQMGWFGMDNATAESRESYYQDFNEYLSHAKKRDLMITIVDCHI